MIHLVALLAMVVGGTALLVMVTAVGWSRRERQGTLWFVAATGCCAWWLAWFGIQLALADQLHLLVANTSMLLGSSLAPLAVLGFTLAYTGRHRWLANPVFTGLLIVPAASIGVLIAELAYDHGLYRAELSTVDVGGLSLLGYSYGTWGNLQLAYAYMLLATSLALLIELSLDDRPLNRRQGLVLVGAILPPVAINMVLVVDRGLFGGVDVTPLAFVVTGAVLTLGLVRYDLLDAVPVPTRVAHHGTLESLDSPVLVLDRSHEVVHANPATADLVEGDLEGIIGSPVTDLPGIDRIGPHGPVLESVLERNGPAGRRLYAIRSTDLADPGGRRYGSILLYQDITDHHLREQRLNVLNRVLRHDIRTEMNVVLGHASRDHHDPEDVRDAFDAIEETAMAVMHTSETARTIERLVSIAPDVEPAGSLATALEAVEHRFERTHPTTSFAIVNQVDRTQAVPLGFEAVTWHLVDNAARHNPRPEGSVELVVECDEDGWIRCTVSDDGPGIPAEELRVFDRGEVTPLEHASGLGLWLVHWVVTEFGGEVMVDAEGTGTCIVVTMPSASATKTAD